MTVCIQAPASMHVDRCQALPGLAHSECGLKLEREGHKRQVAFFGFFSYILLQLQRFEAKFNFYIEHLVMAQPQPRRFAQIVHLKPSAVAAYKECHANVWPEILQKIKECNIVDCKFQCQN